MSRVAGRRLTVRAAGVSEVNPQAVAGIHEEVPGETIESVFARLTLGDERPVYERPALTATAHHAFAPQMVHHGHNGGVCQGPLWKQPLSNVVHGTLAERPQHSHAIQFQLR